MPFKTVNELAVAQAENGKFWQSFIYKSSQPSVAVGIYADSSVGAGIPAYNAYVGAQYEFTPLTGTGNKSIYAGPEASSSKYIAEAEISTAAAAAPAYFVFLDYLGFYPLIDGDSVDVQTLVNSQSLTRYQDGDGVMAFMVMQTPGSPVAVTATMTYTNERGVSGRTSSFGVYGQAVIGALVNQGTSVVGAQANAAFMTLANGDKGIRSIEDITFNGAIGGFVNIVLCKPLFGIQLLEQNTAAEKTFIKEAVVLPKVLPGAFLQFIGLRGNATAPQPLRGRINFVWE